MDSATLQELLSLVHKLTGITMTASKKSMLQARLRKRMRTLGLLSYTSYIKSVKKNPAETQEFINLVTTNETSFFRTARVWDYFSDVYLPQWVSKNGSKNLRIWSAAASSGEEAYSLIMSCEEFQKNKKADLKYQITGTDISTEVLALAQKGFYNGRSMEGFKASFPGLLEKYFVPQGDGFSVNAMLKSKIKFAPHNLFNAPEENIYDIVFLRNVLIYFNEVEQGKVLKNISKALVPGGVLVIGESESLARFENLFKYQRPLIYENLKGAHGIS